MVKVFVSYRRDDSSGHVGRLYDRLKQHFGSDEIFIDIDTIEPGEDFVEAVERAVTACDVLLAVIGTQWLTITDRHGQRRLDNPNDFVRLEIATALQRNVRVVPVLVREAVMPTAGDLPEDLQPLTRRHAIELSDRDFHHNVDKLIQVLDKGVPQRDATPVQAKAATTPARTTTERWLLTPPLLSIVLSSIFILAIAAAVPPQGDFLIVVGWISHAFITEAILFHGRVIERPFRQRLWLLVTTAFMGGPASGLLLRRARPPIGWGYILVVAIVWVAAVFIANFALPALTGSDTWYSYDSVGDALLRRLLAGAIVGLIGGGALALVVWWRARRAAKA